MESAIPEGVLVMGGMNWFEEMMIEEHQKRIIQWSEILEDLDKEPVDLSQFAPPMSRVTCLKNPKKKYVGVLLKETKMGVWLRHSNGQRKFYKFKFFSVEHYSAGIILKS